MGNNAGSLKHHLETAEKTGALCFSEKKIDEFPQSLVKASGQLRNLDLSKNKIPGIPAGTLAKFKAMKNLNLSQNRITSLHDELGQLIKLEHLNMSGNLLTAIPGSIAQCRLLREVNLSGNKLSHFPPALLQLKKVESVDLSANSITALPEDMAGFSGTELNLSQNQIAALPASLAGASRLKTLRVEENCLQIDSIPTRVLTDSQISTLALAGNLFDEKKLADKEGYDKYMERYTAVKRKLD